MAAVFFFVLMESIESYGIPRKLQIYSFVVTTFAFRLHVVLTIHYIFLLLHCTDNVRVPFTLASTNVILFCCKTQSDKRHGYDTMRCDMFSPFFAIGGNGGRFDLHHVARDNY